MYYLDECGIEHGMCRERGRATRGQKVWQTLKGRSRKRTQVMGVWREGKPFVFEGTCKSAVVNVYFEEVLLDQLPESSVVVLDNASFHNAPRA